MPTPVAVAAPPPAAAPATNPVATPSGAGKAAPGKANTPPAGGTPPAETAGAPEAKFKIKVDGQVIEMTQAELERYASKGKYSDKATQEAKEAIRKAKEIAAKLEADAASAKERAKTHTDEWMKEHGLDPDEWAARRLEKKVELGKMTAEQRDAENLKAENARLKAEQEKSVAERKAEQDKQVTSQLQKRIENELVNAAKRAGFSVNDETFFSVYESFRDAYELGLLPVDANGLLPHHADRIIEDAQAKLDGALKSIRDSALKLKGDALLDFIGKDAVQAIVDARLAQIRTARGVAATTTATKAAPAPKAPRTYISPAELDANVKKMAAKL